MNMTFIAGVALLTSFAALEFAGFDFIESVTNHGRGSASSATDVQH
jgi:hypothetical protein